MKYFLLFLTTMLLIGCAQRTYEVYIYCYDNSRVTFRAEVLAEVPHTTSINGELDLPDANMIGK